MPRILLIDDDDTLRGLIAMSLVSEGHEVVEAANGREGVALARAQSFEVVITDLIMPDQEGIETIGILRKEQPGVPVIAISGGLPNSQFYLQIAQKIGAQRVLGKPFALLELQNAIREVLAGQPPPSAPA